MTPEAQAAHIAMLEQRHHEDKKEIESLKARLENVVYFSLLAADMWEKSRRNVMAAMRGELVKPKLRLAADVENT